MSQENKKRKKAPRQDWKPHWIVSVLLKVWMFVFTTAKIAIGAAATVLIICLICGLVFVGILGDYLQEDIMPYADLVLEGYDVDQSSFIYCVDENGQIKLLQNIYGEVSFQHATFDEIPKALKNAAVAIEDKRFYEHQGVDWITTVKAFGNMFFSDSTVGGSSITQQLVKNVTHDDSVTIQRKVLEFFRAAVLEQRYDKDTILEAYLNVIWLGNNCKGVKSAAATYFGKELELLTPAECASLIGITNNPSLYDPYSTNVYPFGPDKEMMNGMQRNRYRQEIILDQMLIQGYLTEEEHAEAIAQQLVLKDGIDDEDRLATCPNETCGYHDVAKNFVKDDNGGYCPVCGTETELYESSSQSVYSWIVDTVYEDVAKDLAARDGLAWNDDTEILYKEMISRSGYHIYTTLDERIQAQVDAIYENLEEIPETYSGQQLQSAIVVIDNRTGDIVALSGGVDEKTVFDAFNIATDSELQSGSSIKPLSIYAPAFELGAISPATVVKDLPLVYEDDDPYPLNDNRRYSYSRTILSAVQNSVNAAAANTLDMIGTGYSFEFAKEKFGLSTLVQNYIDPSGREHSDIDIGPLALGAQTFGVSIRDMSSAFATFANNGVHREARTYTKVYDSEGNLVLDNTQDSQQILSEKTVNYMNYCLTYAVRYGTGGGAYFTGTEIAGKTGTTSSNRDKWFCGFTGYYTAAVWCGYEVPEEINLVGGSYNPAARLWRKVMEPIHSGKEWKDVYTTDNMYTVSVCLDSGMQATDACRSDIRTEEFPRVESGIRVYWEDRPTEPCDKHVLVDYCITGGGVATEYCKHFAEAYAAQADSGEEVVIEEKSLVKMTEDELEEILKAKDHRLDENCLRDDYIYLVDDDGNPKNFKGLEEGINEDVDAPYLVCPMHTQEAWENYQQEQAATEPTAPDAPADPAATTGAP